MKNESEVQIKKQRLQVVKDLLELKRPVRECSQELASFEYDFLGEPYVMNGIHLREALKAFLCGDMPLEEMQLWASTLEFRDDLIIQGRTPEESLTIIQTLGKFDTPDIDDESLVDAAQRVILELS